MGLANGMAWENEFGTDLKENVMDKFKNTYINVSNYTPEEIDALAKKYAEATGLPLEKYLQENGAGSSWKYLGTVCTGYDNKSMRECIAVDVSLGAFAEILTETTEEDLDNYLNNIPTTAKYVEDWDALEVGQKATFRGFRIYRKGFESWEFTEGEVYIVGINEGDKGFIDDGGDALYENPENTFMFELIDEEPSAEITSDYPDYDFKINLEGMSDVEQGLAKGWLKEVAESRGMECHPNYFYPEDLITVDLSTSDYVQAGRQGEDLEYLPEIKLEFSTPTITGFSVDNSKKVLQLEEELATIRSQLKEKEAELESLK